MIRSLFLKGDRVVSLAVAVTIHLLLLFSANITLLKAAEFGVQSGLGGIEINLIAALPETQVEHSRNIPEEETTTITPFVAKTDDVLLPVKIKEKSEKKSGQKSINNPAPERGDGSSKIQGSAMTSFYSSGGADTRAKPNYLKNPAPEYPEISKQSGEEGVVILKVCVEKDGKPSQVIIHNSSGYERLDSSAVKSVKTWQFSPACVGNITFSSWVKIPIRFVLEEK